MIEEVTGVLLAGGASRRFGSNKALALWKGKTLVDTVAEILTNLFPVNLALVKDPDAFAFLNRANFHVAKDLFSETHPLGGIYSGLSYSKTEHMFVCACDMPFLQPKLIEALWDASPGYDAAIPVWQGTLQPMCGIYTKKCQNVMKDMIEHNRLKIRELFDVIRTRFFLEEEVRLADPQGLSFMDLDTIQEYERAKNVNRFF